LIFHFVRKVGIAVYVYRLCRLKLANTAEDI